METVNIFKYQGYIEVTCPECGHWEEHGEDEQRHHLQTFDLEWLDNVGDTEVSQMTCHNCNSKFKLTWNY